MIDNHQPVVMQTVERLLREAEISRDFIVPIGVEQRGTCENPIISFEGDDKLMMRKRGEPFTLHNNAVRQLAEKMDIPSKYLRELSEGSAWQRQLAAEILNKTSGWTPRTRVMIRTVGDQVRGVLSDSYRRLNSEIILLRRPDDRHESMDRDNSSRTHLHPDPPERYGDYLHGSAVLHLRLRRRIARLADIPAQRRLSQRHGPRTHPQTSPLGRPTPRRPAALGGNLPAGHENGPPHGKRCYPTTLQQGYYP